MGQKKNSIIFNLGLKNSEWKSKYINKTTEENALLLYKDLEVKSYLIRVFKIYGFIIHDIKLIYIHKKVKIFIKYFEQSLKFKNFNDFDKKFLKTTNSKKSLSLLINKFLLTSLSLYFRNSFIEIKTQNINKTFKKTLQKNKKSLIEYKKLVKQLKRFTKTDINKEMVKVLVLSLSEADSSKLLSNYIAFYLSKIQKRQFFLFFLIKTVTLLVTKTSFSNCKGLKISISGRFNGRSRAITRTLQIGQIPLQSFNAKISYDEKIAFTANGTFGVNVWMCEKKLFNKNVIISKKIKI